MTDQIEFIGTSAYRGLRVGLKDRSGIKIDLSSVGVREYLLQKEHKKYIKLFASGINELIKNYNETTIGNDNRSLLIATARLKGKIPQLPLLETIHDDLVTNKNESRWLHNFRNAISALDKGMTQGENLRQQHPNENILDLDLIENALLFGLSQAHPLAKSFGLGLHAYEETVLADEKLKGPYEFRKDEIIDAFIEMLISHHKNPQNTYHLLYKLAKDPESADENSPGLGWIEGYDHLSKEMRAEAGCA